MKTARLADWLPRFFSQYLQQNRNVSPHTIAAYRDTFRLLFRFLKQQAGLGSPADMDLKLFTPEWVLAFLNHLEKERGNTARSRNARLATRLVPPEPAPRSRSARTNSSHLIDPAQTPHQTRFGVPYTSGARGHFGGCR